MMRYGSVCSGIEAATAAWHPLGWEPAFFSEIEPFPRAVLQHHYPNVPLHGDFTTIEANEYGPIDLLVGGTPCQSFSIAGLRGGLDDDRGNLALEFLRLADRTRPRWVVWENVPGVLSSNGGRDFGSILGGLVELGYGFAYRVLDAQFFGVAQRRRRVFVVGCLGDAASAAAVLFERHSLQGHSSPRKEKGQEVAGTITRRAFDGGASGRPEGAAGNHFIAWPAEVAPTLTCDFAEKHGQNNQHIRGGAGLFVRGKMSHNWGGSEAVESGHVVTVGTLRTRRPGEGGVQGDFDHIVPVVSPALNTQSGSHHAPDTKAYVVFSSNMSVPDCQTDGTAPTLKLGGHGGGNPPAMASTSEVRRLTPIECERLQGFSDDYTAIPWRKKGVEDCPDGPRYKALGNSMAVPVMRWIGERINVIEKVSRS